MKSFGYYDLIETFPEPGCAFCRLSQRESRRYLDSLLYEYVAIPSAQNTFRASRGLCHTHAWELTEIRDGVLGITVFYEQALDEVLSILGNGPSGGLKLPRRRGNKSGVGLAADLAPERECSCCIHVAQTDTTLIRDVVDGLGDSRFVEAYQGSTGFCLPHLTRILPEIRDAKHVQTLVTTQRAIWAKLQAELLMFIDKHGTRHGDNVFVAMEGEADSWRRALNALAGLDTRPKS